MMELQVAGKTDNKGTALAKLAEVARANYIRLVIGMKPKIKNEKDRIKIALNVGVLLKMAAEKGVPMRTIARTSLAFYDKDKPENSLAPLASFRMRPLRVSDA